MFYLGFRAHDFGRFPSFRELGEAVALHTDGGLVQLAPKKVVPSSKDFGEMTEKDALGIRDVLEAYGVSIAVIGSYINPVHPDPDERSRHVAKFANALRLSSALGCRVVATETGSANPDCSFSEETEDEKYFSILMKTVETLLRAAEDGDAYVALEAVARQHTISSSEKMGRLLEEFKSDRLKVVLDPVNLVPWTGIPSKGPKPSKEEVDSFIDSICAPIRGCVVAIHAKNYVLIDGWKKGDLPLLEGVFDWQAAIPALKRNGIDGIPFLLENMRPSTLKETTDFLAPLL